MPENSASEPFVWRPGRHGFKRLVAHVLIRLLILAPLPPHLQLAAALFPLSLAWPFVSPERPQQGHEGAAAGAGSGSHSGQTGPNRVEQAAVPALEEAACRRW